MRNPVRKMMNPIEMLSADHETVKDLFQRCEQAPPGIKRRLLTEEIVKNLQVHATLEEEIFYPAVREHGGGEAETLVREAYRAHQEIKDQIRELENTDPRDSQFPERLRMLRDRTIEHADKEKQRIFPLAEAHVPLRELALEIDKRRLQLMIQNPAPSVITMVALGLVGIAVMAFVLRRRNAVRD